MFSLMRSQKKKRTVLKTTSGGFSLVELLVVVAILAVLAAIAIPLFLNQKQKAQNASLKSDFHNMIMTMKGLQPTTGSFASDGATFLSSITGDGWKASKGSGVYVAVNCAYSGSGNNAIAAPGEFMISGYTTVGDGTWTGRANPYYMVYDSKTSTTYEGTTGPAGIWSAMNDGAGNAGSAYNVCYGGSDKKTYTSPG